MCRWKGAKGVKKVENNCLGKSLGFAALILNLSILEM